MKKKWISALVCMAMVLSLLPVSAFAEDGEAAATSVKIGSTELENGGIYVPATGENSQYRVVEQFVSGGGQKTPMSISSITTERLLFMARLLSKAVD